MRVIHGFREPQDILRRFVAGEGSWLVDSDGARYLDFSSQYANVNLGHGNRELKARVEAALHSHVFINHRFGGTSGPEELAACLDRITGHRFPAVQFMASGSMAVEAAIKIAREVTGRAEILSLRQSYHGMAMGALSATGYDEIVLPFGRRDPRHLLAEPYRCSRCPFGLTLPGCRLYCAQEIVKLLRSRGGTIAALLAEPVISNQVIVPPPDFWPVVSAACKEAGVLVIADEVVTGLGRGGEWLGSDRVGLVPDMVALGKGMTGGILPFAALLHGPKTAARYEGRTQLHGQTFDGYDLGARTALALIEIIERDRLLPRVWEAGERMKAGLEGVCRRLGVTAKVSGWGLQWGIELSDGVVATDQLHPFAIALQVALLSEGLLMGGLGRVLIATPPFTITDAEMDDGFVRLEKALRRILPWVPKR